MSLAEYKRRFKNEAGRSYARLSDFIEETHNNPSYSTELLNQCEEKVVIPYFRRTLAQLNSVYSYKQFLFSALSSNVFFVRVMSSANLWAELMPRIQICIPSMTFANKFELIRNAITSDQWMDAVINSTPQIITDVFTTIYGHSEHPIPPIVMLHHLQNFETKNNLENLMHLIINHKNSGVVERCGYALYEIVAKNEQLFFDRRIVDILNWLTPAVWECFIDMAVPRDIKNKNIVGKLSILGQWVDEGLIGTLGRVSNYFDEVQKLKRLLDSNPTARAVARAMTRNDSIETEDINQKINDERAISLLEIVLPGARQNAEQVRRPPGNFYVLIQNTEF